MSNYEFRSAHDPKTWQRIVRAQICNEDEEERGEYALQNCYVGTVKDDRVDVYYHKEGKSRLMVHRFIGKVEADGSGCKVTGNLTQSKTTLFFLHFTIAVMAVASVVMLVSGLGTQATAPLLFLIIALYMRFHKPKHEIEMVIRLLTDACTANPDDYPEKAPKVKADKKKKKKKNKKEKVLPEDGTIRDAANWKSTDKDD